MRILLDLFDKPLHLHGYKSLINWGSLRETYAAALLFESKLLEKFNKDNKLFLWDPFCGSGTIMIEAFFLTLNKPARKIDDISKEAFTYLPFHDKESFDKFIKEAKNNIDCFNANLEGETEIQFIGSDIDSKSVEAFTLNCEKAEINKYKFTKNNEKIPYKTDITINPNIFHQKINEVFNCYMGDFETIGKEIVFSNKIENFKNKKFIIFSNIPYGNSHQLADKLQVKSLYVRFGKFLRKYNKNLEDVFILVNKRDIKDELNFKNLTELKWKVLNSFDNNGIEVELLKLENKLL